MKDWGRHILASLLLGILSVTGHAQVDLLNQGAPVQVTTRVDSTEITIGDVIEYSIVAHYPDSIRVEAPEIGTTIGDFTVLKTLPEKIQRSSEGQTAVFTYHLSIYDTGRHVIPPIALPYYDSDTLQAPKLVFGRDIPITVQSVLSSAADSLKDIRPPLSPPTSWAWVLWAVAIMLLLALGYYLWRRYRRKEKIIPQFRSIKIEPAHVIALRELEKLLQSDLLLKGEYKAFFSELSNILRHYLANRYFIPAPEETSEEILRSAIELELADEEIHLLRSVLTLSDQIKFAKYIPQSTEVERAIQQTRTFIQKTRKEFESTEILEKVQDSSPPSEQEGIR